MNFITETLDYLWDHLFEVIFMVWVFLFCFGCVAKVQPKLYGNDRQQEGKVTQRFHAGGNISNTTVNLVGDEVLWSGAACLALAFFGWIQAGWRQRRERQICETLMDGVEGTGSSSPTKIRIARIAWKRGQWTRLDRQVQKRFKKKRGQDEFQTGYSI